MPIDDAMSIDKFDAEKIRADVDRKHEDLRNFDTAVLTRVELRPQSLKQLNARYGEYFSDKVGW